MLQNLKDIRALNPTVWGWVYRNGPFCPGPRQPQPPHPSAHPPPRPSAPLAGVKALPWHTTVRKLLEDRAQWGLFMPLAGCMPSPGEYVCGANASQNLYHDFEETPKP